VPQSKRRARNSDTPAPPSSSTFEQICRKNPARGGPHLVTKAGGKTIADIDLHRLLDLSSDAIVIRDPNDRVVYWNKGAEQIYGYTRDEAAGRVTHELLRTEFPQALDDIREVLHRDGRWQGELVHTRRDSARMIILSRWTLACDAQGRVASILESNTDITGRKRTEEALRSSIRERKRSEEELRRNEAQMAAELTETKLLQSISAQLVNGQAIEALYQKIVDAAVMIMRSDFGSMQMLYPERGNGGELLLLAFHGFNAQAAKFWKWVNVDSPCSCGAALRASKRVIVPDVERCDFMAGTDHLKTYRHTGIRAMQTTPLLSRGGNIVGMISTHWRKPHKPSERDLRLLDLLVRQAADLIDRKRAEESRGRQEELLRRTEKLAAAGQLAASLAHEINNPLTVVTNALYLLETNSHLDATARELLTAAGTELSRVSRIVKQSLSYHRVGLTPTSFDLGSIIEDSVEVFGSKLQRADIQLVKRIQSGTAMNGFPDELRQITDNLLLNAVEAMPHGGSLGILVHESLDWKDRNKKGLRLTILDTGCGIAKDRLARIFEPFFTTKSDKGTGLGLWVLRGLVLKHDGTIRVRSSTAHGRSGTTISIFFPYAPSTSKRAHSETAA
jgi:PAS domain S-box-containing protein